MAAGIPPHPSFLPSFNDNSSLGGKFIAVASALNVSYVIRQRCAAHLHLLLCPHLPGGYCLDLNGVQDIFYPERYLLKKDSLQTLTDAFSACSSFFLFSTGNESEGRYLGKRSSQFRISEGNYFSGRVWTNVLLALNVLVYMAQVVSHGKLTLLGAKVNVLIDKGQLWRLITSSFLHANIGHIMVNCYSLNSIGPTVEQMSGPRRFLAVYFTSAIASSLMSYRFCQSPSVGASGAIFGLVGALGVFVLRHKSLFGGGKQDLQEIGRVIALNMVIGLLSRSIDNWGHLGGLLGGAAMSWFLGPAWENKFGKGSVFVDRAPIFRFINRRRLS